MPELLYPVLAFALSLALVPLVRAIARARGWIAQPAADRWHTKPTALMGGIGIFLSLAVPLAFLAEFDPAALLVPALERKSAGGPAVTVLLLCSAFLFILGVVDDFLRLKPQTKLIGQIMAASLVAFYGYRLTWFESQTVDTLVTILWITGITNALNLIDNMDGLCAGVGAIASFLLGYLLCVQSPVPALAAWCLCAAQTGFLFYNFKPASIFMGDCGSLVIGFSLAFLAVCYSGTVARTGTIPHIFVPLLVLMVPLFDTTLVTLIRTLSGRKASTGGRDHTSHRLVLIGLSEKRAVLAIYVIAAVSGLAAVFVDRADSFTSPAVIVPVAVSMLLMGVYLARLRVYPEKEFSVLRDRPFTPILMDLTYKRQILLVLLDFGLISFGYYLSYRLRFTNYAFGVYFPNFLSSLPAVIACKYIAFHLIGVYRGIWRFLSVDDVATCLKASSAGSLLAVAVVTFVYRFEDFSKGIFVIDWFLTTAFLLGTRSSFRIWADYLRRANLAGDKVLLYGAGRGGEILLREILANPRLMLKPVGFVDDDPLKTGKRLQGFPVLGAAENLETLASELGVAGIVITFAAAQGPDRLPRLLALCKARGLFLKRFAVSVEDVETEAAPPRIRVQ
jgi:UDP-GlcNAc:undecaprenyl-phosphate GlcNAc-1-phosphate transferase